MPKNNLIAFYVFALLNLSVISLSGQIINPKTTLKNKVNQRINQKIDNTIDKGLDKTEDAIKNNKNASDPKNTGDSSVAKGAETPTAKGNSFDVYTKYDFVSGEKIIFLEEFNDDATGDFPNFWNTNSSGEIVKVNNNASKCLQIMKSGVFMPEAITTLPDNFTLEFDLEVNPLFSYYSTSFNINIASLATPENFTDWMQFKPNKHGCAISLHPTGASNREGISTVHYYSKGNNNATFENQVDIAQFKAHQNKTKIHVSIWRQNQRLRVYVNEEKIWDLPRVLENNGKYNAIVFSIYEMHGSEDKYLLSNIRMAAGAPDTRNKLINEGKFVTRGILFDPASATVKPQSYGVIKEIANTLLENPEVKIKITGHTDSDGDDKSNLELSKKRAEAVKAILVKDFKIDASRISTDGKGESAPVDTNSSAEAKANNRRVEFEKV